MIFRFSRCFTKTISTLIYFKLFFLSFNLKTFKLGCPETDAIGNDDKNNHVYFLIGNDQYPFLILTSPTVSCDPCLEVNKLHQPFTSVECSMDNEVKALLTLMSYPETLHTILCVCLNTVIGAT